MANSDIRLGITIRADGSAQVSGELNRVRDSVSGAGNAVQGTNRQFADMASTMSRFSAILGGLTFAALARDILNVNREMETLRATLKSVTGSATNGAAAFSFIQDFAKNTPYDIQGLTQTFIKLKGMGLEPTAQVMDALTNQASKLGGSQETLSAIATQLGQAYSKQKLQQEDLIVLAERGVPVYELLAEVTGKNGEALSDLISEGEITRDVIDQLIIKMGELASGSNAQAIDTLNGAISNLSDAWHTFEDTLLNDQSEGLIRSIVSGITESINTLTAAFGSGISSEIETLKNMAITKKAFLGQFGIEADTSSTDALVEKLTATKNAAEEEVRINQESTKAIKQTEDWLTETTEQSTKKQLASHATRSMARSAASRAIASAIREEERAERKHEETVKQVMLALQAKNQQLSQTAEQYYRTSLAAKGLTDEEIVQAERINAANQRLEEQKTHNEELKSAMDGLIDKYNQLTLSARDYYSLQLTNKGIAPAQQAPLLAQFDKNAQVEASQKAINESRSALQAWVDDINKAESSMQGLGATTTSVFQGALGGVNQLTGSVDTMIKSMQVNLIALNDLARRKKEIDAIKPDRTKDTFMTDMKLQYDSKIAYEKEYAKLQQKTINDNIDGVMQMASATASMFDQNSSEAKAFNIVAIAGLAAKAATAMLTQGEGDPYTAFARIAAMGALVSGIVAAGGGGGFNFSGATQAAPKTTTSTGSVLGNKETQSESIDKTLDLLKRIHAEEYAELRGINRGVIDLKDAITGTITKIFQNGGLKIPAIDTSSQLSGIGKMIQTGSGLGRFDPIANFLLKGLFGTTSKSIVGSGIATNAFTPGGDVEGQQYATVATTKKSWFSTKTSYSAIISELDKGTEEALTSVFKSMSETMFSIAGNLGKTIGKDIGKRVSSYIVPAMQIDLHGLNGEEAAKKLNGVISTALDDMSKTVFGDIIGQYQQLGEGMLETAVRIVSEVAVVRDALNQSGTKMAANAIALSDSLVQAAGGLEQFQQQFASFYDKFFSDTEKQDRLQTQLNSTFAEVYMLLPRTREEYRQIMQQLDLSNQLDRQRYSLMLELSSAADQYYSTLEVGSAKASDLANARANQDIQIMRLLGDSAGALAKERELELAAMDESLRAMQDIIYTLTDLSATLQSTYNTAADMLTATFSHFLKLAVELVNYRESLKVGDLSTGSPETKYKSTKSAFEDTVATIKAGKGTTEKSETIYRSALENLQSVSDAFLSSSRDYNASGKDYAKDFNAVINGLNMGGNKSLDIASDAEKQLYALNDTVSGIGSLELAIIGPGGMTETISSVLYETLGKDGVLGALGKDGVLGALGQKGVLGALGKDGVLGALGQKGVLGALGKDGVLKALGKDGVLGALSSKKGIKGLLEKGGPIADALGKDGVLKALGKDGVLGALGKDGVLKALGQKGVLGALGKDGVLGALGKDGVLGALGKDGVLGVLGQKGVLGALGKDGVLGALGKKGVLGALGKDGVLKALGKDGVLGALSSKKGIKGLLEKGGPIADALGKDGVLKALGKDGVLGALGKDGVLKALGQKGVLGALGKDGVIGALKGNKSVSSAVDLVRDSINGSGSVKTGGLNFAIGSVGQAINNLNSSKGISGAVGDVAIAVTGVKGAIIALADAYGVQQAAIDAANEAERIATEERNNQQKILDDKAAAEVLNQKHQSYNKIYGSIDLNAMQWLARDNGISTEWAQGWSNWATSMVGGFNENESLFTLEKTSALVQDFRKFLVASGKGQPYPHDGAWYVQEFQKLDGAHKDGLRYVPFDGYRAELHKGERVLTATQARNADTKSDKETLKICNEILAELKAANKQRGAVAVETLKKVDKLVEKTESQTRAVRRIGV